jgi:hypothetical protein
MTTTTFEHVEKEDDDMGTPFVTLCALLYGPHADLHKRLLGSLKKNLPPGEVEVRLWLNDIGPVTREWIYEQVLGDWIFCDSMENVPKYVLMREMFHDAGVRSPWLLWFDDDTYVSSGAWFSKTKHFIETKEKAGENPCYIGQPFFIHYEDGEVDTVQSAEWYTGKPIEQLPTRNKRVKRPGVTFAQGAYWWLRTDVMQQLNWPDPRLVHNGGDHLLGQAIRQQGLPFHKWHFGVKINDAKRRGRSDTPLGCRNKRFRR